MADSGSSTARDGGAGGDSGAPSSSSASEAPPSTGGSRLVVNRRRQDGNPLLKYVRAVRYEYGDIAADFECGSTCGVVYLALKYHRLNPDYIHKRICNSAENKYKCKILLVLCNVEEPGHALRELNLLSYRLDWTLIVCYSAEEAAEYIENLKLVENKDPSFTKKQASVPVDERTALHNAAVGILTGARSVTKTDAQRLLFNFGTLHNICEASEEQLSLCPGLGPIRAKNLYTYLRTDFCS